ncbi:MAG: NAD-dependent epimerase/dehydratase family protein [Chryseotalea sp. WA131a]|nr:MAG: NAD-dependent epimerase/dehydratase family protein [Chryseotalea sp. WA131a]
MKASLLILGGTKFLGAEFVKRLDHSDFDVKIASRKRPTFNSDYFYFDRKNEKDLNDLLASKKYDVIVDFLSYSSPDADKLIKAINLQQRHNPFLVVISSTYVYGNPLELEIDGIYDESSFDPNLYEGSPFDRPQIDYFIGKRSMESSVAKNYENYSLIRFPIILGENDNTGRTNYFIELIRSGKKNSFNAKSGVSNFIFSKEAALFLEAAIKLRCQGIFNCCIPECFNEIELLKMYCSLLNKSVDSVIDDMAPTITSPFYYRKDFRINNSKQESIKRFDLTFQELLSRELSMMLKDANSSI